MPTRAEVLIKMYDEHASQARQHEDQREKMTNFILIVTGVLVSFVTGAKFASYTLPASGLLIALGIFGALFSLKHYERFRFHASVMGAYRHEIDNEVRFSSAAGSTARTLIKIRKCAERNHVAQYPKTIGGLGRWWSPGSWLRYFLGASSLHWFWAGIPLLAAVIGIVGVSLTLTHAVPSDKPQPTEVRIIK